MNCFFSSPSIGNIIECDLICLFVWFYYPIIEYNNKRGFSKNTININLLKQKAYCKEWQRDRQEREHQGNQ